MNIEVVSCQRWMVCKINLQCLIFKAQLQKELETFLWEGWNVEKFRCLDIQRLKGKRNIFCFNKSSAKSCILNPRHLWFKRKNKHFRRRSTDNCQPSSSLRPTTYELQFSVNCHPSFVNSTEPSCDSNAFFKFVPPCNPTIPKSRLPMSAGTRCCWCNGWWRVAAGKSVLAL